MNVDVDVNHNNQKLKISPNIIFNYTPIISMCIKHLAGIGIKALLIDMDKTILKIHSFGTWALTKKPLEDFVKQRNMVEDFADSNFFKCLVSSCEPNNIQIFIVSFGSKYLITKYMEAIGLDQLVKICTPSDIGFTDGHTIAGGKIQQINHILKSNGWDNTNIIFIDDDELNCKIALQNNISYTYKVGSKGFIINDWVEIMEKIFGKNVSQLFEVIKHSSYVETDRIGAEKLLKGQVIGTYLTRLAISQPFNVAFCYVQFNQKLGYNMIIHTLIDQHSQIDDWLKTKLIKEGSAFKPLFG